MAKGFVNVRYRKDRGTIFPRIRIYCTSKPIIDEAARIMGVNPFPRRDHGIFKGWYVSASHQKALQVIRRIAPFLKDPSKKCRAEKILRSFENVATIKGKSDCVGVFQRMPASDQMERAEKDIRRLG